jgi:DNA-binding LytR/AlgR family response regulator
MEFKKYNCLVVDDEPIARKIISNYIADMPLLQLAGECINALSAIDYLRAHNDIDILFLDINMPNLSGLQLLKIIQPQQPVIFTTAYSEYAVESYELNAVDYLLKPFSFERFTKGIYKAIDAINKDDQDATRVPRETRWQIFIKSDGKNYPVCIDDILYCEARKNYTLVVLSNGQKLIPLISISRFESVLAEAGGEFIQVHRSFLIAKKHITAITSSNVLLNQYAIPIGIQFKEKFFKAIGVKEDSKE